MLLLNLLIIPLLGLFSLFFNKGNSSNTNIKFIVLATSILNLFLSLIIFIIFDFSTNQFQFVQEYKETSYFNIYLGIDGLSIYFILLTTIIIPISLLSNWTSVKKYLKSYVITILLLESLLLAVFIMLDILLFYIFFESILPPLFILIGIFGSDNRVKASFYLFLYTLLGSLFLLLSILSILSFMGMTDFDTVYKGNFLFFIQLFIFYGIFIAFAVKTPTIFLNTWLLKAHVESPLGGSIILAAIVLKLSLYGILRLILPILPKAYIYYTFIIFAIGVITILYASISTLRTIDVKELIAYSSVSHASVYLVGLFSNSIQGIEGGITLGLAHGFVSPGLFICAGGILYDRCHTRVVSFFKGMAQLMPLFAILFLILSLGNCGAPLTLNFIGEFMSLYGTFERLPLMGVLASSSIVFSAAYTMYLYNRISFGGAYSAMLSMNIPDLIRREFAILLPLTVFIVIFGVYTLPILDGIHYNVSQLIFGINSNYETINCDASATWESYFHNSASLQIKALVVFAFLLYSLIFNTLKSNYKLLSKYYIIIKDKYIPELVWTIENPPKPHAFTNSPLHSAIGDTDEQIAEKNAKQMDTIQSLSTLNERMESIRDVAEKVDAGQHLTTMDKKRVNAALLRDVDEPGDGIAQASSTLSSPPPRTEDLDTEIRKNEGQIDRLRAKIDRRNNGEASDYETRGSDSEPGSEDDFYYIVLLDIPVLRIIGIALCAKKHLLPFYQYEYLALVYKMKNFLTKANNITKKKYFFLLISFAIVIGCLLLFLL